MHHKHCLLSSLDMHTDRMEEHWSTFWSSIAVVNDPSQTYVRDLGIKAACEEDVGALDIQVQGCYDYASR